MHNSSIDYLYHAVRHFPNRVCVSDQDETVSFLDLFRRAFALVESLAAWNISNRPILVYLPKSVDAVVSFAAVLLSGNFYVPADTKSPLERIEKIIKNLDPYVIITQKKYLEQISTLISRQEKIVVVDDISTEYKNTSIEEMIGSCKKRTDEVIDLDPCYIMYTSGSTGIPKGVVIPHRGVIDYIEWAKSIFHLGEYDIIGNQAPLFFDNSTLDIYLSWSTGAALHLIPESLFMFPIKLIEHLEEKAITFIFFVPSVLSNIAQMNVLSPGCLGRLRYVVFAGEVMPTRHLGYWQNTLPDKVYVNLYGPTEITVDCTYFVVDRIYGPEEILPIGYPCRNSGVLILNDKGQETAVDERGELCVRGSSLALGYWGEKERTGQVFIQNPLQSKYFDRIYRTGDIVYKNDRGQIIFLGRQDSQIKHMGYRIELEEIERAAASISTLSNCCALYQESRREITLFYESPNEIHPSQLINELSKRIPSYMMPRKFYHYKKLPLNPNGKIDRKALHGAMA